MTPRHRSELCKTQAPESDQAEVLPAASDTVDASVLHESSCDVSDCCNKIVPAVECDDNTNNGHSSPSTAGKVFQ